jgi:hypothetical protein
MVAFLYHWFWLDLYIPVWPNIVASLFCFAFILVKLRTMEKLRKLHHREAMQLAQAHHTEMLSRFPSETLHTAADLAETRESDPDAPNLVPPTVTPGPLS